MNNPVQSCTKCGAGLTPQDLMGVSCRYCGQALPHQVAAAQQAQLVNQVLANPQAMNNMMANAYPPPQYGVPPQYPQGPYGASSPGAYGPYGGQPGPYYGAPQIQASMARAQSTIVLSVVISLVVGLFVMGIVFALVMR